MTSISSRSGRSTIWDVARVAGVSGKTVSRVLNGEPGVTDATAAKVLEAVAALGFRRNETARLLRTGRRVRSVGLVMDDLQNPDLGRLAGAVAAEVRAAGFVLVTVSADGSPAAERDVVRWLLDRQTDALLIVPTGDDHRYLLPEIERGLAVVFVGRPPQMIEADCVIVDDVDGGRQATDHLLRHWHRRIGFIGGPPELSAAGRRLKGYREALTTGGIWIDPELIRMGASDSDGARQAAQQLLALSDPPTALVAAGSRLAVGAVDALQREATALVAFDDLGLAETLKSPVTTVDGDPAAMGAKAAEMLTGRLSGNAEPVQRIVIPVVLTARGSGEQRPALSGQKTSSRRWYRR